jgi:hypothetical protein
MAVQLPSGAEMRLTVSGIVRGLENDGRAVWMRAGPLLAAQPGLPSQLAIVLRPGADRGRVDAGLRALDVDPARPGGATTRDPTLLGILAAVLRSVALAVALVCLYALVQGLAMTARERRGAIAVLRAVGGGRREVALLLGGAAAVVAIPSAAGAIALGVLAFAPAVASAAAGYAGLPLAPSATQAGMVLLGFALLAAAATAFVARAVLAEPVVAGLRDR